MAQLQEVLLSAESSSRSDSQTQSGSGKGGDTREDFWGILAQERRYFAWVLGYFLLTLVPSLVFFFMWLFRWSHVNDLQNKLATVDFTNFTIGHNPKDFDEANAIVDVLAQQMGRMKM
ncbi:hypothetical protein LTR56_028081 [Elasticomyces elasticus]|nr:hypothetical protein LTR56_028081 [Elasticomyces elasticus]KAK3613327.1 hypothetical protein LTR22_028196 [Elasticomyces elasticus]